MNAAGSHAISAIADYYIGDNPDNSDRTVESLVITAGREPETQSETDDSIYPDLVSVRHSPASGAQPTY